MILPPLVEWTSPWIHVQLEPTTHQVSQGFLNQWHLFNKLEVSKRRQQDLLGCCNCREIMLNGKLMTCFDTLSAVILELQDVESFVDILSNVENSFTAGRGLSANILSYFVLVFSIRLSVSFKEYNYSSYTPSSSIVFFSLSCYALMAASFLLQSPSIICF
jgi:hypothetical protein